MLHENLGGSTMTLEQKKWILDLGAGFGGASEYFTLEENWTVIRIENNPLLAYVEHTRILDIHNWEECLPPLIDEHGPPTFIWASPTCREFSLAYSAPQAVAARWGKPYQPDMTLVRAIIAIIEFCQPRWHVVENVHGSKKWFEPEGLMLKQTIGPFQLYGKFPHLDVRNFKHKKTDGGKWSNDPLRNNHRAIVPIEISHALYKSVTGQSSLLDFI